MTKKILTQEYLKECLDYSPETGIFTKKVRPRKHFNTDLSHKRINIRDNGKQAGNLSDGGYIRICIDYKSYRAHRLAFLYMEGYLPTKEIDHINHERSDNRWANLRVAGRQENAKNQTKRVDNTSGYTGVSFCKKSSKWTARLKHDGKYLFLGYFNKIEDAINARKLADIKCGYHRNHGRSNE